MPQIPDFHDLRYLNEIGWFLYREKYGYNHFTDSYAKERLAWSPILLEEFLSACGQDRKWLENKTIVSIGCGCTGDLAAWPAALKIAVDGETVDLLHQPAEKEDVNIEFVGNELTVTGEIKERERQGALRQKTRRTGRFDYRVVLREHVDPEKIDATLSNGVLTVRVPKSEHAQRRKIEIKT